jgi:ABC-2 type transport system ATP-binding protein
MENQDFLEVKGLSKKFGTLTVVDNLSFSVNKAEVFALLGPNGAGKTTTIKMLCGLLKADGGDISIGGVSVKYGYHQVKSLIGLCPQDIIVWELLTCLEQLKFVGIAYGMNSAEAKDKALKLLKELGLLEKKNKLAMTLSGGMLRRLNIALALIHNPELIILDEPQAGLDPQSRILVRDFIKKLAKEKAVILTTHDMEEAEKLSDRVAIIDHGKILAIDTPEQLKKSSEAVDILQIRVSIEDTKLRTKVLAEIPSVFLEKKYTDGMFLLSSNKVLESIAEVNSIFEKFNLEVKDLTIRKRTLEDVFIKMTGRGLRE